MNRLMVLGLTVLGVGATLQVINLAVVTDLGLPVVLASIAGATMFVTGAVRS